MVENNAAELHDLDPCVDKVARYAALVDLPGVGLGEGVQLEAGRASYFGQKVKPIATPPFNGSHAEVEGSKAPRPGYRLTWQLSRS